MKQVIVGFLLCLVIAGYACVCLSRGVRASMREMFI